MPKGTNVSSGPFSELDLQQGILKGLRSSEAANPERRKVSVGIDLFEKGFFADVINSVSTKSPKSSTDLKRIIGEIGDNTPKLERLIKVCKILGVDKEVITKLKEKLKLMKKSLFIEGRRRLEEELKIKEELEEEIEEAIQMEAYEKARKAIKEMWDILPETKKCPNINARNMDLLNEAIELQRELNEITREIQQLNKQIQWRSKRIEENKSLMLIEEGSFSDLEDEAFELMSSDLSRVYPDIDFEKRRQIFASTFRDAKSPDELWDRVRNEAESKMLEQFGEASPKHSVEERKQREVMIEGLRNKPRPKLQSVVDKALEVRESYKKREEENQALTVENEKA
jgi:flagellar biosynthesis/type III secretory pathway chaperone